MRLLSDTDCWMSVLRDRPDVPDVRRLLAEVPHLRAALTNFALHSIGVVMLRKNAVANCAKFIGDVGMAYGFDLDDAYQYVAAEVHGLRLVSLNADFAPASNGRLTPAVALQQYNHHHQR